MRPCEAVRPERVSAFAMPDLRSTSTALSMSPEASVRAFLHSIIPAPVFSRSVLTSSAVIVIELPCVGTPVRALPRGRARLWSFRFFESRLRARGRRHVLGLGVVAAVRDGLLVRALERHGARFGDRV